MDSSPYKSWKNTSNSSLPSFILEEDGPAKLDRPERFLRPESLNRGSPSPTRSSGRLLAPSIMGRDDATEVVSHEQSDANPFNFQTQVISTSPVKSVSFQANFVPGGSDTKNLLSRMWANVEAIDTNTVASQPSIKSSKNHHRGPLQFSQLRSRYRHRRRHGLVCAGINV